MRQHLRRTTGRRGPLRHRRLAVQRIDHLAALGRGRADARRRTAWPTTASTWPGCPGRSRFPPWPPGWPPAGRYAAVLCLGAVIRGETSHDQHINRAVSIALAEIGVQYGCPCCSACSPATRLEQAIARSGGQAGTRGKDRPDSRMGNKGSRVRRGRPGNGQPDGEAPSQRAVDGVFTFQPVA